MSRPALVGGAGIALGAAAALLVVLSALQAATLALDLDYALAAPLFYYQAADVPAHEPLAGPRLYGLRPGYASTLFGRRVTVNSLGFRGPERPAAKAPGTLRIVCLGSSNTYGASVNDSETWPAQLERRLAARLGRRVEVWNGGVCAYGKRQVAAAAEEALARYSPDLLLLQFHYQGRRALLQGDPLGPRLEAEPGLWLENLRWLPFGGSRADAALLSWRGPRTLVVLANRWGFPAHNARYNADDEDRGALRRLLRTSPVPVLIVRLPNPANWPSSELDPEEAARTIDLSRALPKDAPETYLRIHPPAGVYRWYAEVIARDIARRRLVPGLVAPDGGEVVK